VNKSHLPLLLLVAIFLPACSQQESDWKFPAAGMATQQDNGETWYDLGDGLLARRSNPADGNSNVLVRLEAPRSIPQVKASRDARDLALSDESGKETPALMALADEIFESCATRETTRPTT